MDLEEKKDYNAYPLDIYDTNDTASIISLVTDTVKTKMWEIPPAMLTPQYVNTEDRTHIEYSLRRAFWKACDLARITGKKVNITEIATDVCSVSSANKYFSDPEFFSWVLRDRLSDKNRLESLYEQSLHNLESILSMDLTDVRGKIDSKKASVFLSAFKMIEDRVKGSVINRSESKNLTVKIQENALESRDKRIEFLKKKLGIDVEPKNVVDIATIDVKELPNE